jgi:hypothetical protein
MDLRVPCSCNTFFHFFSRTFSTLPSPRVTNHLLYAFTIPPSASKLTSPSCLPSTCSFILELLITTNTELEVAKRKEERGSANPVVQTVIWEYIQTTDNSVVKVFDVTHHKWNAWTG